MSDNTSGIWTEHIDPETGESSITELVPRVVKTYCAQHYFVISGSREVECAKCGIGSKYIPGLYRLEAGRLIKTPLS